MERKHKLVDKHPVAGGILICLLMMFGSQTIASIPTVMEMLASGDYMTQPPAGFSTIVLTIIATAIALWFYKRWFRPEFKGVVKGEGLKEGLLFSLPIILYWIITAIGMSIEKTFAFKGISVAIIATSVMAGCIEEISFRHGLMSTILRNENQENNYVKICLISAIVFGVIHLLNAVVGANLVSTLVQVLGAGCLGVFFAALFLRTGNILPSIIVHTVHDIYAISVSSSATESGLVTGGFVMSDLLDLLCCLALAIYAIKFLLPKEKRGEIKNKWDLIWSKNEQSPILDNVE